MDSPQLPPRDIPSAETAIQKGSSNGNADSSQILLKLNPYLKISKEMAKVINPLSSRMLPSLLLQAYKPPALVRIKEDHQCPLGTLSLKQHQILVILSSIPSLNIVTGTKDGQIFKLAAYDNQALFSPSTPHAKQLYTYKDLLSAPEQPCLVSPLSDFRDKKNRLIEKGTPLLVKWSHSHFKRSTPKLRTLDKEAVYIPSDIPVQFSSRPQDTCLVLNDLLEHFQLPLSVTSISGDQVELCRVEKEDTLIARLQFEGDTNHNFYIPTSLPIMFEVLRANEVEKAPLNLDNPRTTKKGINKSKSINRGRITDKSSSPFIMAKRSLSFESLNIETSVEEGENTSSQSFPVQTIQTIKDSYRARHTKVKEALPSITHSSQEEPTPNHTIPSIEDRMKGHLPMFHHFAAMQHPITPAGMPRPNITLPQDRYIPENKEIIHSAGKIHGNILQPLEGYLTMQPTHLSTPDSRVKHNTETPTPTPDHEEYVVMKSQLPSSDTLVAQRMAVLRKDTDDLTECHEPETNTTSSRDTNPLEHYNYKEDIETYSNVNRFHIQHELEEVHFLKKLTVSQILQLLKSFNLACYCKMFQSEMISGELFVLINDKMLDELGVCKEIHRMKIKLIAKGTIPSKHIFNCQNKM